MTRNITHSKSFREMILGSLTNPYKEPITIGILALFTGIIGGFGAIVFRDMIQWIYFLFHFSSVSHSDFKILIPALGLTIVGIITRYFAREVKGHGVPQILESLALRGGKIRPRVAFFGILAPAITIGADGSVGREGPIALIGGAFGSILGQLLKVSDKYTSLLLACGSAAGIAATFNAPIAGGFFGLEVILGSYALGAIMPVFLSAVTGSVIFDSFMGNQAVLPTPTFHVIHPIALIFMLILGILSGFLGLFYSKGLTIIEDLFSKWAIPFWVKTVIGGIVVGTIGLIAPQVLGVGYGSILKALNGQLAIGTLLLLFVFKYIATLTTIGAGGSGGVFAPSLFLGSMFGAIYGFILQLIFPALVPNPEIYAIAGMGAIFAAAAQAPFVAITILLEVTGDYQLTPVVMAACVAAYVVYGVITQDSMYTVKLSRRGIRILRGNEVRPTEEITVQSAMEDVQEYILDTDTIETAYNTLTILRDHVAVVTNAEQMLIGIISLNDLIEPFEKGQLEKSVSTLINHKVPFINPDKSLEEAMRLITLHDLTLLPVVDDKDGHVVGTLTQRDIVRAYNAYTIHSTESNAKIKQLQKTHLDSGQFLKISLDNNSPLIGLTLSQAKIPQQAVIVSIQRKDKLLIPHGQTALKSSDEILLFVSPVREIDNILSWFKN